MKRLGKFLSGFICCLGVGICVAVALMFMLGGDGDISNMVWTDEAIEEYKASPEDFSVEYIKVYDDSYFTEDGYLCVSKSRWIPSIEQWQMTIRYNKSTLESIARDRGLEAIPDGDVFTFTLVDNTGIVYTDFQYLKEVRGRYTYYRLIFDDVSIKKIEDITIYIYFTDDIDNGVYPDKPLETLPLYYAEMPRDSYDYKDEIPDSLESTKGLLDGSQLLEE